MNKTHILGIQSHIENHILSLKNHIFKITYSPIQYVIVCHEYVLECHVAQYVVLNMWFYWFAGHP